MIASDLGQEWQYACTIVEEHQAWAFLRNLGDRELIRESMMIFNIKDASLEPTNNHNG